MFYFCLVAGLTCFVLTLTSVKETPLAPKKKRKNDEDEERKPLLSDDNDEDSTPVSIPVYRPTTGPDRAYSYDALIRHSPRQSWFRGGSSVGGDGGVFEDGGADGRLDSPQRTRIQSQVSAVSTGSFVDIKRSEAELNVSDLFLICK